MSMSVPLEIVEGRDGTLQDVLGRPMVIVFDANDKIGRKDDLAIGDRDRESTRNERKPFLFVDASAPTKRDASFEKLVRSHVRRKQTTRESGDSKPQRPCSIRLNRDASRNDMAGQASLPSQPSRSLGPFACYPVQMQPHMYRLVHNYLTVHVHTWFPKEPEHKQAPGQHTLFDLAMSDASLFQAIMCSSSLCLDMAYGRPESSHSIIHRMEAIHLINARLKANSRISDATIGAVAFLAIIEFILGNHEASNVHKTGLLQMVKLRGGLRDLDFSLQMKVWRICSSISHSTCLPSFPSSATLSLISPLSQ
ncbi:hypothetical protein V8E51_010277 [Hyaloscypha variabilis]